MKGIGTAVNRVLYAMIGALFLVMVLSVFLGVVNRGTLKATLAWPEEVARYAMVWMTFLAVSVGLGKGAHIGVETVTSRLSPAHRRLARIFSHASVAFFAGVSLVFSITIIRTQISTWQVSAALGLPMFVPYLSIPMGMALTLVESIALLAEEARRETAGGEAS